VLRRYTELSKLGPSLTAPEPFLFMPNAEHVALLQQGTAIWNAWRIRNPGSLPDLSLAELRQANLSGANLRQADLSRADLKEADLKEADLSEANLGGAELSEADLSRALLRRASLRVVNLSGVNFSGLNLSETDFSGAILSEANLKGANLREADLVRANLSEANLSKVILRDADLSRADLSKSNLSKANLDGANLRGANLNRTELIGTDFSCADLRGSSIYGIAAWDVKLTSDTRQENLIITPSLKTAKVRRARVSSQIFTRARPWGAPDQSVIVVDNIKVAQFIYLLLNNEEIRDVIDTVTSKAVLILGRFTPERKKVLDALQTALRKRGFVPITFDFDRPTNKDFSETIMTLAGMSCFIIADITNPKSSPLEIQATVPNYMIPFIPIIQQDEEPFSMFRDLHHKYEWVLPPLFYDSSATLVTRLKNAIILPALEIRGKLAFEKAQELPTRSVSDYPEDNEL